MEQDSNLQITLGSGAKKIQVVGHMSTLILYKESTLKNNYGIEKGYLAMTPQYSKVIWNRLIMLAGKIPRH